MAEPNQNSAIRRKAGAGRPPPEISPATAASALRTALVQAGEDIAALVLTPTHLDETRTVMAALETEVSEYALLAMVEGPQSSFGLIVADPDLVAGLIEKQTTGRVVPNPATPRAPTRTDAIMCADFFDCVLERFEAEIAEANLPIAAAATGYRFALRLEDIRAATMALADIPYRKFDATMDIDSGAKKGSLSILLPYDAPKPRVVAPVNTDVVDASTSPDVVLEAQAELRGILHRVHMTLEDVTGLSTGMTIALSRDKLGAVVLEDLAGEAVAKCRLGQAQGQRALRIGAAQSTDRAPSDLNDANPPMVDPSPAIEPVRPDLTIAPPEPVEDLPPLSDMGLPEIDGLGELPALDDLPPLPDLPPLEPETLT